MKGLLSRFRVAWIPPALLAILAGAFAFHPEPGAVAASLCESLRLDPFASLARPLWRVVAALPAAPYTLSIASALSLALIAGALARLLSPPFPARGGHASAGHYAAALVFACPSFLWLARRPLPGLFCALPAIAAIACVAAYAREKARGFLLAAAGLWVLAMIETPVVIPFTAILWVFPAWALHRLGDLNARVLQRSALVAGSTLVLATVLLLTEALLDPSAAWRDVAGPRAALRWLVAEFVAEFRRDWPDTGWLYLFLVCWLPAAATLAATLRRGRRRRARGVWFTAAALPGLAILADLPIAPHHVIAPAPTPVFSTLAALAGLALCIRHWIDRISPPRANIASRLILAGIAVLSVVHGFRQRPAWNHPALAAAREAAASFPRDAIVITDGAHDDLLRIASRPRNIPIIDISRTSAEPYRRYVASLSQRGDWPAIADVSPAAAIRDRLREADPDLILTCAPEWIVSAGRYAVPTPWGYVARDDVTLSDLSTRTAALRDAIARRAPDLSRAAGDGRAGSAEASAWRASLSRAANNLGVLAEHLGADAEAEALYREARAVDPPQWVASMNLATLLERRGADRDDDLWLHVESSLGHAGDRLAIRRWLARGGMLRSPDGLRRWNDTLALAPGENDRAIAARRAFLSGDAHEARRLIEDQLHPASPAADWILYALCADALRDNEALTRAEAEMARRGESWASVLALVADRMLARDDGDGARALLHRASQSEPWNTRVLESRIRLALHEGKPADSERLVARLLALEPGNPWANFALGLIHVARNRPDLAEPALLRVAGREAMPLALNNLAWILAQDGRHAEALPFARRAVELDPYGAPLWDTLGAVLSGLGRTNAARTALDRARILDPNGAGAMSP